MATPAVYTEVQVAIRETILGLVRSLTALTPEQMLDAAHQIAVLLQQHGPAILTEAERKNLNTIGYILSRRARSDDIDFLMTL